MGDNIAQKICFVRYFVVQSILRSIVPESSGVSEKSGRDFALYVCHLKRRESNKKGGSTRAKILHPLELRCERGQMVRLASFLPPHEGNKGEAVEGTELICLKEVPLNDNSPTPGGTAA